MSTGRIGTPAGAVQECSKPASSLRCAAWHDVLADREPPAATMLDWTLPGADDQSPTPQQRSAVIEASGSVPRRDDDPAGELTMSDLRAHMRHWAERKFAAERGSDRRA